ncbi:dihydrolipoyl dehydrogenase [Sporosarcina sp. P21c]|uniref:dihydrolipoyl dehydrogenase n=1 Tax=unclassified Sporosarcina TaxID=2647733 RepID=UPI000C16A7E0|nr:MULTISPECIES: dihydrolipoyl dehydrogenase [unclassified Sporosarcina]PIC66896.1 dihydrolipoyl dehydrogenase [Sporosarcina sp. P16a]PIC89397.1 dihydrolipoyl dehydrogenase [Sporosarcina sp. P21c]PIC92348.1 dihydrolipoyl dehydrogenase [Sporosarcina sp. P25]
MSKEYDVVILGGGTGGYVAAIRAAQLGLTTAIVEKSKLGGTCLHSGCIPSKAMLKSAEVYRVTRQEANEFGVNTGDVTLDFSQVQKRKGKIVDQLHAGIEGLMKKGKIDVYQGTGRILGASIFSPMPGTISVEMDNGNENEILILKNLVVATGSKPRSLPGLEVDESSVMTSDGALLMNALPSSITIIGGGVIGIEWASMLVDFGVDVTVMDRLEQILATEDHEVAVAMHKALKKRGVKFILGAEILTQSLQKNDNEVTISYKLGDDEQSITSEKMLVSVGRAPVINDIGLQNTDIQVEKGSIQTNAHYQTKDDHIYAIGDVIGGLQLAHVAEHEGLHAIEHIAGKQLDPIDYDLVPRCVYSYPETAAVGLTEQQAKDRGFEVKIGKFPFKANGKALVNGHADGFVKLIVDQQTDDIIGVHMMGSHVTDLISEAGLAMVMNAIPWEISSAIHPHPTLSEAFSEAALAVEGLAIHM